MCANPGMQRIWTWSYDWSWCSKWTWILDSDLAAWIWN
jgi:hypothetical protein